MVYNRKLDSLNRVVIPADICAAMNVGEGNTLTIRYQDGKVLLEPEKPFCRLCGASEDINKDIPLCPACLLKARSIEP